MQFFIFFIILVIIQRFIELVIARLNEKKLKSLGAVEYDSGGYLVIVVMHICFFLCLITEKVILDPPDNKYLLIFLSVFVLAQFLRYWAIKSLGEFWNTRIIIMEGAPLIKKGPYKYLSHPNYVAVITEIAVIPLMFSCYITAFVFTLINSVVLYRRIKIESALLNKQKGNQ